MNAMRAVCVHDLAQARAVIAAAATAGAPPLLMSGPGAALYAGCAWWHALIAAAGPCDHILDCADAAGIAMAALRLGQRCLVLSPRTPALAAVLGVATTLDATVLTARPPSLDLATPNAARLLRAWVSGGGDVKAKGLCPLDPRWG